MAARRAVCGWLKDRFGLSWQITPQRLLELIGDPDQDRARRAMEAMMKMKKIDIAASKPPPTANWSPPTDFARGNG